MLQTVISSTPVPTRSTRAHRSSSASSSASLPPNSPGARALKSVLQPVIASSTSVSGYDNDRKFFLGDDKKVIAHVREPLFEPLKLAVEERGPEAAMSERGRSGLRV